MAHLSHLVSVALIALVLLNSSNMSEQAPSFLQTLSRVARSANNTVEDCELNSTCGWVIFKNFKNEVDYYMSNNCKCPEPSKCVQTDTGSKEHMKTYRCKSLPPSESSSTAAPESPREPQPPQVQDTQSAAPSKASL